MDFLKSVEWPMWFGFAAVASSIVTCAMKTMIPLRIVSMVCNSLFIIYGFFGAVYPTLLLNLILLPLNSLRLHADAKADPGRRGSRLLRRHIDRLAQAIHVPPVLPQRRDRVPQGRRCRCDVLQRQRTLSPVRNGNRHSEWAGIWGTRADCAAQSAHADGRMHRRRRCPHGDLSAGEGTLFPKSAVRVLLSSLNQRASMFENIERLEQELVRKNQEIAAISAEAGVKPLRGLPAKHRLSSMVQLSSRTGRRCRAGCRL